MPFRSVSTNSTPLNSYVLSKPTGCVDGDILVVALQSDTNVSVAMNFGALGFTEVSGSPIVVTADGMVFWLGWKVAATEPSQYTFIDTNGDLLMGILICLSGMVGTMDRAVITGNSSANVSPWAITTLTFASGNTTAQDTVVFFGASDVTTPGASVSGTAPATYSKQADSSNGTFFNMFAATHDAVSSGFSGVLAGIGTALGSTSGWVGATIAFQETGGGGGSILIDDDVFLPWNRPVIPEPSLMVFG